MVVTAFETRRERIKNRNSDQEYKTAITSKNECKRNEKFIKTRKTSIVLKVSAIEWIFTSELRNNNNRFECIRYFRTLFWVKRDSSKSAYNQTFIQIQLANSIFETTDRHIESHSMGISFLVLFLQCGCSYVCVCGFGSAMPTRFNCLHTK